MITRLKLQNFKGWRELDVPFAPLTCLFGTNSSGKTSIIQSLLLMKQTAASPDRRVALDFGGDTSPVELGTFVDVVYQHDPELPIELGVNWRPAHGIVLRDPLDPDEPLLESATAGLRARIGLRDGQPVTNRIEYTVGSETFRMARRSDSGKFTLSSQGGHFRFQRRVGRPATVSGPVRFYGFPAQVFGNYTNADFLSDLELAVEYELDNLTYLGPLREDPHRQYTWGGARPADVGQRGEKAVEALLAARASGLTVRRSRRPRRISVEEWVAGWLRKLGLISSFEVVPVIEGSSLYQVKVRRSEDSTEVLLTDVGFGVSQVLPVLVLLAYAPVGSVIVLEQPEIHLHPAVQAGLADVILDAIEKRDVQVIVESHSEHFLQRLQRRVAEEAVVPENVALYFCDHTYGAASISTLELDIFGNIANWPEGFFGDPLGDALEMARAAAGRQGVS